DLYKPPPAISPPSPGFAQHRRAHDRVQARQLSYLREIGFHARIAAHRLDGCGGLPLGVDDDARAVLCRDQPGRLPAVERADHRVGVLLQERDERILLPGFDLQQIDQNNGLVGHGVSPSVSDTPRTTRRAETDHGAEDFLEYHLQGAPFAEFGSARRWNAPTTSPPVATI